MIKLRKLHTTTDIALIVIEGDVKSTTDRSVVIACDDEKSQWPLIDNRFRGYFHLKKSINTITISCNGRVNKMTATHTPMKRSSLVELLYVTCEESRSDVDVINNCKKKIALLSLLAQYFFANTTTRKSTFALKLNRDKIPIVHELIVKKPLSQLQDLPHDQLWQYVAQELLSNPLYSSTSKYFAVTSFNSHSTAERKIALSAGGLSLCGSYILDEVAISDPSQLSTFLASHNLEAISNCIGCCVHEMGHMFDLGHSTQGIMSGDVMSVGDFFVHGKKSRFWSPSSSQILSCHKYLNKPSLSHSSDIPFTYVSGTIKSQHGILVVEWRDSDTGLVLDHVVNTLPCKMLRITQGQSSQLASKDDSSPKIIIVMDTVGNLFKTELTN